jgi:DNA-damage-inducible protein D
MELGQILDAHSKNFEDIKHIAEHENGSHTEVWLARELMPFLGYREWRNFQIVIQKAITACALSDIVEDHFVEFNKMVPVGSNASRSIDDYYLSRTACYLIAQNGDSKKPEIAAAQMYFTTQTRRQEMQDQMASEDKRIAIRERLTMSTKRLNSAAKDAGVTQFGLFNDAGYQGLYGGKSLWQIRAKKGLSDKDQLFDHIGATELAANDFRATQAEERLKREGVKTEQRACDVHKEVGKKVREAIKEMGNPMPEDLPIEQDIKPIIANRKKAAKMIDKM